MTLATKNIALTTVVTIYPINNLRRQRSRYTELLLANGSSIYHTNKIHET